MNRFFRSGSIGNWTNISNYSDTDYFAWIPWNKLNTNSSTSLREIKEALQKRFPNTNIYVDNPSVVVEFWTVASENTEIIPADYLKTEYGVNIYDISDKNNSWMEASPTASNDYITKINSNLSSKVKPLIRFVKAWKYYNNVPISSYYLEMKVAKYAENESAIFYLIDLSRVLKLLIDSWLSDIVNPTGIWGYIKPCISDVKKNEALSKLNTMYSRICNAIDEENQWKTREAFSCLDLAYNGKFPSYYN